MYLMCVINVKHIEKKPCGQRCTYLCALHMHTVVKTHMLWSVLRLQLFPPLVINKIILCILCKQQAIMVRNCVKGAHE